MGFDDLVGHWPKECSCGKSWDEEGWSELPLTGRALLNNTTQIETRSCECGSPLAVVILATSAD